MSNHGDTGANGAEGIQQADSGANLNVNDGNDAALPALAAPARQALAANVSSSPVRCNSILLNIFTSATTPSCSIYLIVACIDLDSIIIPSILFGIRYPRIFDSPISLTAPLCLMVRSAPSFFLRRKLCASISQSLSYYSSSSSSSLDVFVYALSYYSYPSGLVLLPPITLINQQAVEVINPNQ